MKSSMKACSIVAAGVALLISGAAVQAEEEGFVGGSTPDQRPAGAPTITEVQHDQAWYEHALTGVEKPYPRSLLFLDNQGDWWTPFTRPGMPGPYDIRGWHKKTS